MQLLQSVFGLLMLVAAVRAGPVSPNNGNTTPNGNASPNNNGKTPSTSGTGSQDTNLNGSFKFCRCVDSNQNALKTPTNAVYQGYLPTLPSIKLDSNSAGAYCENDSNWNGNDFKKLCVNAGDGAVTAQCWN